MDSRSNDNMSTSLLGLCCNKVSPSGWLQQQKLNYLRSGACKSEIKVWAGVGSSGGWKGRKGLLQASPVGLVVAVFSL